MYFKLHVVNTTRNVRYIQFFHLFGITHRYILPSTHYKVEFITVKQPEKIKYILKCVVDNLLSLIHIAFVFYLLAL